MGNYSKTFKNMTRKEAINKIKMWDFLDDDKKEVLKTLIPELKESENERIRKALITFFNRFPYDSIEAAGTNAKEALAWLERQESVDKIKPKFNVGDTMRTLQEANDGYTDGMPVVVSIDNEYYHCTNELIAIKDQDNYEFPPINVKQEPTDKKVEPKFNIGDWIVYNRIDSSREILYVYDIRDNRYYFNDMCHFSWSVKECDEKCHLWTIRDAKDGDVLSNGKMIVIFKHFEEPSYRQHIVAYVGLDMGGDIQITDDDDTWRLGIDKAKPATKEQRDLLFAKMKEAGLEWNSEKKELKTIKQKLDDEIEPKFKVSDWVVDSIGIAHKIERTVLNVTNNTFGYDIVGGGYFNDDSDVHLWTIKDAKDGDVVVDKSDGTIGIFQSIGHHPDGGSCNDPSYCFLHCRYDDGFFYADFEHGNTIDSDDLIPATKEERDLLFTKMKEAGYVWDAEKKESKKIDEDGIEYKKHIMSELVNLATDYVKQKSEPAWSEEDEKNWQGVIDEIGANKSDAPDYDVKTYDRFLSWLKSIKQRLVGEK